SFLLLENWKWSLMPQFQPGRYLLFVTLFAVLLASAAGIRAAQKGRYVESFLFFLIPFACPTLANLVKPMTVERVLIILFLADYKALRIDFVVFQKAHQLKDVTPVYENSRYVVYRN